MSTYVTGDIHGNQLLMAFCVGRYLQAGDTIIVLGDWGIGFFDNKDFSERAFLDLLAQQDYQILFLDGNHEEFPRLNDYPVEEWQGGRVHRIRPNILHLMRGEIYQIDDKNVFVFGGGSSSDRNRPHRKEGVSWWPEEMPSEEEYENAKRNLKRYGYEVDYILTHTAPGETIEYMRRCGLGVKDFCHEEMPLNGFLDGLHSDVKYKKWLFGHFHIDFVGWRNQYAVLHDIRELHSGERIWTRYTP